MTNTASTPVSKDPDTAQLDSDIRELHGALHRKATSSIKVHVAYKDVNVFVAYAGGLNGPHYAEASGDTSLDAYKALKSVLRDQVTLRMMILQEVLNLTK